MSIGSPRAAMACAAAARCASLNASRAGGAAVRRSFLDWSAGETDMQYHLPLSSPAKAGDPVFRGARDRIEKPRSTARFRGHDGQWTCGKRQKRKQKCEAAMAVGALDPGVPYESRWAPCDQVHGPGQGQFPEGSIRPRGYMAPDARHSFASPL